MRFTPARLADLMRGSVRKLSIGALLCAGVGLVACGSSDSTASSVAGGGGVITGAATQAASSSSASSAGAGGAVTTSVTTGAGGSGGEGVGGSGMSAGGAGGSPPPCTDIGVGEPNETETNAFQLPPQTDCQSASSVSGTIAGGEEDWFRYAGDDALCAVNPDRAFSQDGGLMLCKFFECDNPSATTVDCPSSTTPTTSPGGRPGCCATQGFGISAVSFNEGVGCSGTIDDNMTVFLQVRAVNPSSATCADYSISYSF